MIALFSPSEGKKPGGSGKFSSVQDSLVGGWVIRESLVKKYEKILSSGSVIQKKQLTGWGNAEKIAQLPTQLSSAPVLPVFDRYNGVGFQYVDAATLNVDERRFLEEQSLIFSNLLGPLRGTDHVPEVKLKQCTVFAGKNISGYYRKHTSNLLDEIIGDGPVLDLRAGAYKSFYAVNVPVIECVFFMNGKKMNHWSKASRGLVLRAFAKEQPETIEDMLRMKIPHLKKRGVSQKDQVTTVVYDVHDLQKKSANKKPA